MVLCACGTIELPPGDPENGGLFLPDQFQGLVVVDSLAGKAREITVSDHGDLYVKTQNSTQGNIVGLRDNTGDGKADAIEYFADTDDKRKRSLQAGVEIYNGYLYFSTTLVVYRMKLIPGSLIPEGEMEVIVRDDHEHGAMSISPSLFPLITKEIFMFLLEHPVMHAKTLNVLREHLDRILAHSYQIMVGFGNLTLKRPTRPRQMERCMPPGFEV